MNARNYGNDRQFGHLCKQGYMPQGKLLKLMKIPAYELDAVIDYFAKSEQFKTANHEGFTILFPPENSLDMGENCHA